MGPQNEVLKIMCFVKLIWNNKNDCEICYTSILELN